MPTASETRAIGAPAGEVWRIVCDPHHLPRWWPRVDRVEAVKGAFFTELLRASSGKLVRADFEVAELDEQAMRVAWSQQIAGTPFAHALASSQTEVQVRAAGIGRSSGCEVTLTLEQRPKGLFTPAPRGYGAGRAFWSGALGRLGSPLISRAAVRTVNEALDGLEAICG